MVLFLLPLISVYYNFRENARAFLDFFKLFHTLEFSTSCGYLPCYFTEQVGVDLFPFRVVITEQVVETRCCFSAAGLLRAL